MLIHNARDIGGKLLSLRKKADLLPKRISRKREDYLIRTFMRILNEAQ